MLYNPLNKCKIKQTFTGSLKETAVVPRKKTILLASGVSLQQKRQYDQTLAAAFIRGETKRKSMPFKRLPFSRSLSNIVEKLNLNSRHPQLDREIDLA